MPINALTSSRTARTVALALALALAGCDRPADPAQVLAAVNGKDITVRQLDDEMQRVALPGLQPAAARKQMLERLIDRQLLQDEAAKEKIARDPRVLQVIDRARSQIVAEAYLQKRIGKVAEPSQEAIADYFQQHPELFSARKQFDLRELVFAATDMRPALDDVIRTARTLDTIAAWMETHQVAFARTRIARTTGALPANVAARLTVLQPGQLLMLREGNRVAVIALAGMRDDPVTLEAATGQIGQYLTDQETRRAFAAEFKRLRAAAHIAYVGDVAATQ